MLFLYHSTGHVNQKGNSDCRGVKREILNLIGIINVCTERMKLMNYVKNSYLRSKYLMILRYIGYDSYENK